MGQGQAESLLAQTRLFAGLDASALATLAAEGHERSYKRHAPVFHEGEPGDAFFVIMSGAVKVYVTSAQGAEMVLTTVRSPGTLGGPASAGPFFMDASGRPDLPPTPRSAQTPYHGRNRKGGP